MSSRTRAAKSGEPKWLAGFNGVINDPILKNEISGALLLDDQHYVQVLEGDEALVRELYEHIAKDQRHDSVALLESGIVDARVFSRWSMARVGEGDEADIPLIAHTDGISPAAGRRATPEQEAVLDVMRAAARAPTST